MTIQYKVAVNALPQNVEILMELFEAKSDADQFFLSLQDPEKSPLANLPYQCLSLTEEEFHNGVWTVMSRKLVTQ